MDEKTLKALEVLASKLGTTSEFVWGVLVKQAVASASINLIVSGVLFVIAATAFVFLRKNTDKLTDACVWAFSLILISMAIIFVFVFPYHISTLINPEYWALNRILEALNN